MEGKLKPGQVYVRRGDSNPEGIIIHKVKDDDSFYTRHTSCMNTHNQFGPVCTPGETQEEFLEKYELATSEKLEGILAELEEQKDVISEKIQLLRKFRDVCEKED